MFQMRFKTGIVLLSQRELYSKMLHGSHTEETGDTLTVWAQKIVGTTKCRRCLEDDSSNWIRRACQFLNDLGTGAHGQLPFD